MPTRPSQFQEPRYGERFRPLPDSGKTMLLVNFQDKLSKLHKDLYVKTDERKKNGADFWISGIYFKQNTRVSLRHQADNSLAHSESQKYLEALEQGNLDAFITGICLNHIPEYDVFDLIRNSMLAPGWRKIVLRIVAKKICTIDQARKVFDCSSLGTTKYDNMKFLARLTWSKELAKGKEVNA